MVKLSQQLQEGEGVQDKITRTQRVTQKQEFEKEKRDFKNLKSQATEKQKEFEGITSIDEYEQKYNLLDPSLKQFFQTPKTLRTEKITRIETAKQTVQKKQLFANQKIADAKTKLDKNLADARDRYGRQNRSREWLDGREKKYEDDYDETVEKWRGYKKGLDKGLQELNQNKDVAFYDIENYASDLGRYEQKREEARNKRQDFEINQELERRRLEEAGYKPQVIEKSFKGKPTAVQIGFYNPKTKDWVSGTEYKVDAPVDVTSFERLGYSEPQQRQIEFGGKTYGFQSRVGIYKAPSGEIVTPYEKTGITEAQIKQATKKAQDEAFKEYQKTKPVIMPFEVVGSKDLPIGYGGQQTISTEPTSLILSEEDYYRDIKKFDLGVGKVWGGAKAGFKFIDERVHYDFSLTGSPSSPKLSVIKFGKVKEPTLAEKYIGKGVEGLKGTAQNIEEWAIGKQKIEDFGKDIEKKYQSEYQARFEQKYMQDLIYGTFQEKIKIPSGTGAITVARDVGGGMMQDVFVRYVDGEIVEQRKLGKPIPQSKRFKETYGGDQFERASLEFAESKDAKILQKKFAKEYGEEYKELQTDVAFWRGTAGGVAQTGVGLGSFALKSVSTPSKTALTIGAVYGGVKVLQAIPPVASTGLSVSLFGYGTYKFLDPSSTYVERGGGLVTLSIAGATLGYGAYRYLRSPVVKAVKIKAPKQTLRASEVIGKDIKILTDKGMVNKVIFQNQKLSQTATAGRRTIVTTKVRELVAKYTKFKPSPIYRGIPTQQLGTAKYYERFGGLVKIGKQSGYQKAFAKLTDYGYTTSQARSTLKYIAPKVTEQYLSKGVLTVKGSKAFGEFEYLTKKPVIDVDKTLGIKTRGGKTIKDVYDVERKLITIERGKKVSRLVLEQKTRVGFSLKGDKLFKFTETDFSKGLGVSKATKELRGYEYIGKDVSGLDIFKEAKYKDIYSISATKKIFPADKIIVDASKTKLINKILDLRKKGYVYVKPTGIKKTPFDITDDVIKKIRTTPSSDISKIIDKLDDIGTRGSPTAKVSKYYGTGQYEKAFGGIDPKTSLQLKQQLKVAVIPDPLKATKLKDLIKIKQFDVLGKMDLLQIATLKTLTVLKTDAKLKTELKARNDLKILLKEDVGVKTKTAQQLPALKTSPTLKSQLKTILDPQIIPPSLITSPVIRMPTLPRVTPPIRPIIALPFLKAEISKRAKKGKGASVYDRAYLPDFTARALGLETETITQKQANKKLKKLLTGLEIRRGIKIK